MRKTKQSTRQIAIGIGALALCGICGVMFSGGDKDKDASSTATATAVAPADDPAATELPSDATETAPAATEPPAAAPTDAPPEPTAEPATEIPTDAAPVAPPATEAPTAEPAPPTEPPAPRPDVNPDGDRDCKDFVSRQEAQAWWDYWRARGYDNPGRLDGGKRNGIVCESY